MKIKTILAALAASVLLSLSVSAEEAKPATEKAATPAPAADSVGVAECDDFLKKYEACVTSDKVPAASQTQFKAAIKQMRDSWKQLATTDQGKAALKNACTQALTTTKQATAAFGCTW